MDTALSQKYPFILDRNLAKANCTENRVCTSCDIVFIRLTSFQLKKCQQVDLIKLWPVSARDRETIFRGFLRDN